MSTETFEFTPIFKAGAAEETRDEACEVLFDERVRLFRFDAPSSEWKERGTGNMKVLHDKETDDYYVVQRRDVTFKLSAYFFCDPAMELKTHGGSDKAYTFTAYDYSYDDNKQQGEAHVLAAMFKTAEIATAFQTAFEKGQEAMKLRTESKEETKEEKEEVETLAAAVEELDTKEEKDE